MYPLSIFRLISTCFHTKFFHIKFKWLYRTQFQLSCIYDTSHNQTRTPLFYMYLLNSVAIFLTQRLNPGFPCNRQLFLPSEPPGKPQEYWNGQSFPSPGDLPDPGIKPGSPALQADSLLSEPPGKPQQFPTGHLFYKDRNKLFFCRYFASSLFLLKL